MARPPKPIDWNRVEKKMEAKCTATEIAGSFHMDLETFSNRFKAEYGKNYTDYLATFHNGGKANLKERQYAKAMEGNAQMLIWLGKQWLAQTETEQASNMDPQALALFQALMAQLGVRQEPSSDLNKVDNSNISDK